MHPLMLCALPVPLHAPYVRGSVPSPEKHSLFVGSLPEMMSVEQTSKLELMMSVVVFSWRHASRDFFFKNVKQRGSVELVFCICLLISANQTVIARACVSYCIIQPLIPCTPPDPRPHPTIIIWALFIFTPPLFCALLWPLALATYFPKLSSRLTRRQRSTWFLFFFFFFRQTLEKR